MEELITLSHGAGGSIMQQLIKEDMLEYLEGSDAEVPLRALDDAAVIRDIILKSDSYTVKPLFFPGGDIGRLAVAGTVNDICAIGGEPLALAMGFIFEEGFPILDLRKVLQSIHNTCVEAGAPVITGDTKVVERGALDKFVINSSGIGLRSEALDDNLAVVRKYRSFDERWLLDSNIRAGDRIIVSGTLSDHGIAVMSSREGYGFESDIVSDVAPLNKMIRRALEVGGITCIKDPTRGGLANLLNEWCEKSKVGIKIYEDKIPIREGVKVACEMLGIDVLQVGNEGKVVMAVIPEMVGDVLTAIRETREGKEAHVIGEATDEFDVVVLETLIGGRRIIAPPAGDPIPRIC